MDQSHSQPWSKPDDELRERPPSLLSMLEDDFVPYAVTSNTVVLDIPSDKYAEDILRVYALCQENCLTLMKFGLTLDGLAITFLNQESAALFRLFWID